ncbi:MAG: purine-nucleoside phosphorylase [Clostridia bacterium]|nr:purine-nucleoside phosphorylase [Clostridia bacterium]
MINKDINEINNVLNEIKIKPKIALILGSGFKNILELENKIVLDYKQFGFDFKEIEGHKREFIFGYFKKIPVVIASRMHFYETGNCDQILKLTRILFEMGVRTIIATTAVGGINSDFNAGDMMLIESHINLTGTNPLIGLKPIKFVDMCDAYNKKFRTIAKKISNEFKIKLWEGVHIQVSGPTYETPAEVIAFKKLGADTISMSTALDCICANYYGMNFVAFAGITNQAFTESSEPLTHEEVVKSGNEISKNLGILIRELIPQISEVD